MPVDRLLHPRLLNSEKVGALSHLEYRAWQAYMLIADDFGVMPMMGSKLHDARGLHTVSVRTLQAALEKILNIGLVRSFTHQGQVFMWSPDWQFHQKIRYPRREETHYPHPPEKELIALDHKRTAPTRALFATFHMQASDEFRNAFGDPDEIAKIASRKARRRGRSEDSDPGSIPGTSQDHFAPRAYPRDAGVRNGVRLTANGQRLTADGVRPTAEVAEAMPLDVWLRRLQSQYPPQAVTSGFMTESAFHSIFSEDSRPPAAVFDELIEHLDNQKNGYQWRVKRMIPRLERWLREGLWRQLHDAAPPTTVVSERTISTHIAGEAFVKGGDDDAR